MLVLPDRTVRQHAGSWRNAGGHGALQSSVGVSLSHRTRQLSRLVVCSSKGTELLKQAKTKYTAKDLMGALKLYEDVLGQGDATTRQKQEALYGSTAVHATFGDVELAQITLREAIKQGLDFEQALADPDLPELVTSTQILIQLKRFNQQAQTAMAARSKAKSASVSSSVGSSRAKTKRGSSSPLDQDLGDILGSSTSDKAEVDTSVGAIVRRVALVVLAGVALGTALFFIGLETLFPKY
eukprot:GHUV01001855.1.p1 GENE.GHUV01001855.1~~GHUV01001855.1.p1  ORF type:complete len:240 (+),score=39.92 GHUV01001855.1:175-894(+)